MWVDDHRCFPNARGCQHVEFRRLLYWNTSRSITHSAGPRRGLPWGGVNLKNDKYSATPGMVSPLWWQMEAATPLPFCRVELYAPKESQHSPPHAARSRRPARGAPAPPLEPPHLRRIRVSLIDATGALLWQSPLMDAAPLPPSSPHGSVLSVALPGKSLPGGRQAKFIRVEQFFNATDPPAAASAGATAGAPQLASDDAGRRLELLQPTRVLSFRAKFFTDEPLNWPAVRGGHVQPGIRRA